MILIDQGHAKVADFTSTHAYICTYILYHSRNILLTDQGHAKVADFGCARKLKGIALQTTTISGSPAYMAPEQVCKNWVTSVMNEVWN